MSAVGPGSQLGEALASLLSDRPLRVYPAVMSAEVDAMAWAREGAEAGSLVTAEYQLAPRGRAGLEWELRPERDVAFSLVLRPDLPEEREGWLYTVATTAVTDVVDGASIGWPDEVHRDEQAVSRIGVQTGVGEGRLTWSVISVLLRGIDRLSTLAESVAAIERRLDEATEEVLADHRNRVSTIGRSVRARLLPMGPTGVVHEGEAVAVRDDGGLAIRTRSGSLVRIVPQTLGVLEQVESDRSGPGPDRPLQ